MRRATEIFSLSWRVVAAWWNEISAFRDGPRGEESANEVPCLGSGGTGSACFETRACSCTPSVPGGSGWVGNNHRPRNPPAPLGAGLSSFPCGGTVLSSVPAKAAWKLMPSPGGEWCQLTTRVTRHQTQGLAPPWATAGCSTHTFLKGYQQRWWGEETDDSLSDCCSGTAGEAQGKHPAENRPSKQGQACSETWAQTTNRPTWALAAVSSMFSTSTSSFPSLPSHRRPPSWQNHVKASREVKAHSGQARGSPLPRVRTWLRPGTQLPLQGTPGHSSARGMLCKRLFPNSNIAVTFPFKQPFLAASEWQQSHCLYAILLLLCRHRQHPSPCCPTRHLHLKFPGVEGSGFPLHQILIFPWLI